jgi:leucyl aminopeptidase (aminopeptidase T)
LVYPGRKVHDVLPQFAGTNVIKLTADQRAELLAFVAEEYRGGRSLCELAELAGANTDRDPAGIG